MQFIAFLKSIELNWSNVKQTTIKNMKTNVNNNQHMNITNRDGWKMIDIFIYIEIIKYFSHEK